MDYEQQIRSLAAETLALQFILTQVLSELRSVADRSIIDAIGRGFDNAASQIEHMAIQAGESVPPEHLVKALRVVEELRIASLGSQGKPKGIV
jgi:hypothetical protein